MNRRLFLKFSALVPLTTGFFDFVMKTSNALAAAALQLIDMTGKKRTDVQNTTAAGIARSFGYIENADKENRVGAMEKPGAGTNKVAPKNQYCNNCQYHVAPPGQDPKAKLGKDQKVCQLIANVLVHDKGWCKMWQFGAHKH